MKPDGYAAADTALRVTELLTPLLKMLDGESPRAKVILLATRIDEELELILKKFLKPRRKKEEKDDELFRIYAPLSSFSARIAIAYRLGLISKDEADALDVLRDLRNDCAHKIFDFSFGVSPTKDRAARFVEITCRDPSRAMMLGGFVCPQTDEHALIFCCLFYIIYLQHTNERLAGVKNSFSADIFGQKEKLPNYNENGA